MGGRVWDDHKTLEIGVDFLVANLGFLPFVLEVELLLSLLIPCKLWEPWTRDKFLLHERYFRGEVKVNSSSLDKGDRVACYQRLVSN